VSFLGNLLGGTKSNLGSFGQQKTPASSLGKGQPPGRAASPVGTASPTWGQSPKRQPDYSGIALTLKHKTGLHVAYITY